MGSGRSFTEGFHFFLGFVSESNTPFSLFMINPTINPFHLTNTCMWPTYQSLNKKWTSSVKYIVESGYHTRVIYIFALYSI